MTYAQILSRQWPSDDQALLVKMWNKRRPNKSDHREMFRFKRDVIRHTISQNVFDYRRRGKSNREGANNRGFRKHQQKNNVIFDCEFYSIVSN